MVSKITLGNTFDTGGRTVIGGSNSGIDTEALVKGLTDAKRLPAVKLEKRLELDAKKQTALTDLKDIVTRFKDAANFLRNPSGVQNYSENIFEYRNATLSSNTGVNASNYLSATIAPGADLSDYNIQVGSLATYNIQTTNTFALVSTLAPVVGAALPVQSGTLSVGTGATAITLADGDTLQQVIDKINATTDQNKVQATAIQVSTGNYRIQLKATDTGTALNYTPTVGIFGTGFAVNQAATDASITIDGTTIASTSNSISTAIEGITLELKQPTGGATLSLNIDPDTEVVKTAILNFVDLYNELKFFNAVQGAVGDDSLPTEDAVLHSSSAMRSTMASVTNEIAAVVSGLSSSLDSLADLGITFTDFSGDDTIPYTRNTLVVDEETLDSKLASDFNSVRKIFEFDFVSSDSQIQVFSRTNSLSVSSFSLNINIGTNTFEATYSNGGAPTTVTLTATAINNGGFLLEGPDGSPLDGLQLVYGGTTNTTANITVTQGIGDRIYNALDDALEETSGMITVEYNSITDSDKRMETEITRIDDMVERFRLQLLDKFSRLESALGTINSILSSIDANNSARNNA
jgi:flagellar hook-associated protein 2